MQKKTDPPHGDTAEQRRRFLRLFGTAAALLPVTMITGCSDDSPPAPPAPSRAADTGASAQQAQAPEPAPTPQPEPEPAPEPEPQPATETAAESAPGEMPKLSLDDPTAQALGYKHDAANIDAQKYPQRGPDQICANCTLYRGTNGKEWGGCQLFQGKLVNANGWCSGYVPKPS